MANWYDKVNLVTCTAHYYAFFLGSLEVVYLNTCASHVLVQGAFGATVTETPLLQSAT